jgi:hypothetical protein
MDQATNSLSAYRLVRYVGIDRSGFTRVWGQAETSGQSDECSISSLIPNTPHSTFPTTEGKSLND